MTTCSQNILQFVHDYIKMDGIFILKMITIHSGVLICSEIVDLMWDQFINEQGDRLHSSIVSLLQNYKRDVLLSASPIQKVGYVMEMINLRYRKVPRGGQDCGWR